MVHSSYQYRNMIPGKGPFLFLGAAGKRTGAAEATANELAAKGCGVFLDCLGPKDPVSPSEAADAIDGCSAAVFFLSPEALDQLTFRNQLNFALARRKNILCFTEDGCELSHGMDMQLANIERIPFENVQKAVEHLCDHSFVTQDLLGQEMEKVDENRTRKQIFVSVILLGILLLGIGSYFAVSNRIQYYRSAEYVLRNADNAEYIDATAFGHDAIDALAGKSVVELDLSDAGLESLEGLDAVSVQILDLPGNPELKDLSPVLQCEGLTTIRIDQNMIPYATRFRLAREIQIVR